MARACPDVAANCIRGSAAASDFLKDPPYAAAGSRLDAFRQASGSHRAARNQFAAAVRSFEQAVALLPHEPTDRHNFAVALAAVGEYGRAAEESRRAHELAPDNPDIKRFMDALIAHEETQRGTLNAQKGPN